MCPSERSEVLLKKSSLGVPRCVCSHLTALHVIRHSVALNFAIAALAGYSHFGHLAPTYWKFGRAASGGALAPDPPHTIEVGPESPQI